MRKHAILLFLTFRIAFTLSGQQNWFRYDWNKISPKNFSGLYDYVYDYDMAAYKDNIYIGGYYKKFSEEMAASVNYDILHGNFYSDFNGYENYLKKILEYTVNDTSITNRIKILLYRDNYFNASMNESGILRLNVGAVARLGNEAELALLLGHEVAHFVNKDAVKRYGRKLEQDNYNFGFVNSSLFFLYFVSNPFSYMYWHNREEESAADFTALNYLKRTKYSLKSAGNLFKIMWRMDIRSEYADSPLSFYKSHPDPGNRAKQMKALSNDSLSKNRKNFMIDSVSFVQLKKLCFNEAVNISLVNNSLNDLMSLSFTEYLIDPDNKKNLAVLIESLRRFSVIYGDEVQDRSFILYPYQENKRSKADNYKFLDEKTPSVLKVLTKGFIDLGKDDLKYIKATELTDTSDIKFSTNKEALSYFIQKALDQNCTECLHYKYFDSKGEFPDADQFIAANDVFNTNDYIKNKNAKSSATEDCFIVLPTGFVRANIFINRKSVKEQTELYNTVVNSVSVKTGKKVLKLSEMSFTDQQLILSMLTEAEYFTKRKGNSGLYTKKTDWIKFSPEFYSFFSKNNIRNLYVCDFNLRITGKNMNTHDWHYNPAEKALEDYTFYKISLPGNGNSFTIEGIGDMGTINEDPVYYSDKFANKFNFFYTTNKN
jgi:hypothetical protein